MTKTGENTRKKERKIMTREEAKKVVPILQAFADGKTIQYRPYEGRPWRDLSSDEHLDADHPRRYRIKPEPREIWVNEYKHGLFCSWCNSEKAAKSTMGSDCIRQVRFREVID